MANRVRITNRWAAALLAICLFLAVATPQTFAGGKALDGRWSVTIKIPESPFSTTKQELTLTWVVSPREANSLHGRLLITDAENRTVGGVWRQVGKKVSIAFELPCTEGDTCASLILLGKIKAENTKLKKGKVIVMWDTPNDQDHTFYDTSKGTFTGDRLPDE